MALTWYIEFDWDNNGTFEANETGRCLELNIKRGREEPMNGAKGFAPMSGTATFVFDNYDRRYDPYYSSSALYPNVKPGRDVKIRVNDGSVTSALFRGKISDIVPLAQNQRVRITVKDGWGWLNECTVGIETQQGVRTHTAIETILNTIGYPTAWGQSLQVATDILPYWWESDENAAQAIGKLAQSEFGIFYIAADGKATFISRVSLYNEVADVNVSQTDLLQDIALPRPWASIRNIIRVSVSPLNPINSQTAQTLWTLNEKPAISASGVYTVEARLKYNNLSVYATSSQLTVTAVISVRENGTGGTLTSTAVITAVKGNIVLLTITNTGASQGWLTTLKVTATQFAALTDEQIVTTDDSAGSDYGPRAFSLDLPWQQNVDTARQFSQYLATLYGESNLQPVLQLEDQAALQFRYDLTSAIGFSSTYLGVSKTFRLMGLEHKWLFPTGQGVRTTWFLEPLDETAYWNVGTSQLGTETVLAY